MAYLRNDKIYLLIFVEIKEIFNVPEQIERRFRFKIFLNWKSFADNLA